MKIIYPDKRNGDITANEEDVNYPAVNLQNDYPQKVWKATSIDAYFEITTLTGSNCVAVFNTNATSAVVSIGTGAVTAETSAAITISNNNFFYEYTTTTGAWTRVDLESPAGTILYAGVAKCGVAVDIKSPLKGLKISTKDLTSVLELSNGSFFINDDPGAIQTISDYQISLIDSYSSINTLVSVAKHYGQNPMAIALTDDNPEVTYAIFGKLNNNLLSRSYLGGNICQCDFVIIETP